jgi:hypothetical protein
LQNIPTDEDTYTYINCTIINNGEHYKKTNVQPAYKNGEKNDVGKILCKSKGIKCSALKKRELFEKYIIG